MYDCPCDLLIVIAKPNRIGNCLRRILNGYFTYIEENNDETFYEKCNTLNEVHLKINTLKTNQKNIFNVVLESLKQKQKNSIFIDGPGGSGKSYLLNILINYLKFYGIPFLCVAWTGMQPFY